MSVTVISLIKFVVKSSLYRNTEYGMYHKKK